MLERPIWPVACQCQAIGLNVINYVSEVVRLKVIAEQLFRPYPTLQVTGQARLFNDLNSFLDESLTEQSCTIVKARPSPLETACHEYDVDAFRSAPRPYLACLSDFRGLVPPKHLVDFAQVSAPAGTDMRRITVSDSV